MEDQVEVVARAFVEHYYNLFNSNRASLSSLYQLSSILSFEGQSIIGADQIQQKLSGLPFGQCQHFISTIDSQPSVVAGSIIVFVTGSLKLLHEEYPLKFSQMFQLIPTLDGTFFVQNDIFRLTTLESWLLLNNPSLSQPK
ncbi:Nuclear transport factor 2 [Rhynchospora pubera]|uniref:NTF2-related export protein n=1 Tax=Rhynchospora pubera TaxID=906938 RepID=A0AAV8FNY0_9POAL|nr:Nuclear transport factor 2 [Rhynchospora pubera]